MYGGYQMLNGSLDDFYCISLDESLEQFHWYSIMARSETTPGCRSKHALLAGKSKIYLVGGLQANSTASHDIFEFDTLKEEWKLLVPNGIVLPGLESFGAVRM